jgi:hypothetical protein
VRPVTIVAAVTLGLLGIVPAGQASATEPTPAQFRSMGATSAPAYRLPAGCHWYHYNYRVSPPEQEWTFEVFITDAAGVAQASDVMVSGADATRGTKRFQLCASNTAAPGLFTIRGRITYKHYAESIFDETVDYSGWVATSHFRVTKPGKHRPSARCVKARKKAKRVDTPQARRAARRACRG